MGAKGHFMDEATHSTTGLDLTLGAKSISMGPSEGMGAPAKLAVRN